VIIVADEEMDHHHIDESEGATESNEETYSRGREHSTAFAYLTPIDGPIARAEGTPKDQREDGKSDPVEAVGKYWIARKT